MPKFQKKRRFIEAVQLNAENAVEAYQLLKTYSVSYQMIGPYELVIYSSDGNLIARPNDYIVRGLTGEFYPLKADIFEHMYEEVK